MATDLALLVDHVSGLHCPLATFDAAFTCGRAASLNRTELSKHDIARRFNETQSALPIEYEPQSHWFVLQNSCINPSQVQRSKLFWKLLRQGIQE